MPTEITTLVDPIETQFVILAGGLGTRLGSLTKDQPKPMVPVCGKPFLEWQLRDLKKQGAKNVLLLVSYLSTKIMDYFRSGEDVGLSITYSVEKTPLGTGGGLLHAWESLQDEFILLNGDSFLQLDYRKLIGSFRKDSNAEAMMVTYSPSPTEQMTPNVRAANGRVIQYQRGGKPQDGFREVDTGVFILKRKCLDSSLRKHLDSGYLMFDVILKELAESGCLGQYQVEHPFYDIGSLEGLNTFSRLIERSNYNESSQRSE